MPINPQAIHAHRFSDITHEYVERDAIIYALGIGLGENINNQAELEYLQKPNLKVLPTMAVTLGTLGLWVQDIKFGIDVSKLVHAGQSAVFQNTLPPHGAIIASARIASLSDRGQDKGAILTIERHIRDSVSNMPYCSLTQTLLLRGDGGFGGPRPEPILTPMPAEREPDHYVESRISARAALIYQLSGDWNPLHTNAEAARRAGFQQPILHGLASYGIAGWAILKACANANASRLGSLACRFTNVVYPGEKITISIWQNDDKISFQANTENRKVLDHGTATLNSLS